MVHCRSKPGVAAVERVRSRPRRLAGAARRAGIFAALSIAALAAPRCVRAEPPSWLPSASVYCVYPRIFSPAGNLAGVAAQLPRLRDLGITVVWLMPVTPVGEPIAGHPAFGSPYCVHDYDDIRPDYGTAADLTALVRSAHRLGMHVILDEVLNHTSWDNPLVHQHPEYYVHTDGDPNNAGSIAQAFTFADVAQLDFGNRALWPYLTVMLRRWVTTYGIDGFRFDTADNPYGSNRRIPAAFWRYLRTQLVETRRDLLLLGECEDPDLAPNPFALDYGWRVEDSLQRATVAGSGAASVRAKWERQHALFSPGALHLRLQDDWDQERDVNRFGGVAGARAAAVFNMTIDGVPLIYNGMEIGNAAGGVNPNRAIDWAGGDPTLTGFYRQMLALRKRNPALQQGTLRWTDNTAPDQLLTYRRLGGDREFLVEINLSGAPVYGSVGAPAGAGWTDVTPGGSEGPYPPAPPTVSLAPHGFAIFARPAAAGAP
jgi:glycosidase